MKKIYHIYNNNFEITHAQFFIEGEQPSNALFIENCSFVKPMVNPETLEVYEGATPEEIAKANKPKVPVSISQMKLRKQLILSGISISSIDTLIHQLPQPNKDLIYTMWEYAVVFDRINPELNAMAEMLGITQEQLDDIFIKGNEL
jgi:hypothetical protein